MYPKLIKILSVIIIFVFLLAPFSFITKNYAHADDPVSTKTVEYYLDNSLWQRSSGVNYTSPDNLITLPEDGIEIQSAFVEVRTMVTNRITSGSITLAGGTGNGSATTTTTSFTNLTSDTNENFPHVLYHDATNTLSSSFASDVENQAKNFRVTLNFTASGSVRSTESAKLVVTYQYDPSSTTQVKTIKKYLSQRDSNLNSLAVESVTIPALSLPEDSVSVKSTWAEVRGVVRGGSNQDPYLISRWDFGSYYYGNGIDMRRRTTTDFMYMTKHSGYDPTVSHTLWFYTYLGNPTSVLSQELVMTYQYNHENSSTLRKTVKYFIGQDTTLAGAGANTYDTGTQTFTIPEASPSVWDIYTKTYGLNTRAANIRPNINGTDFGNHYVDYNSEQSSGYTILSDANSVFPTISQGSNSIRVQVASNQSRCASRNVELYVTYDVDKSEVTQNRTVEYFVHQDTSQRSSNTDINSNFTIPVPEDSPAHYSSYLDIYNMNRANSNSNTLTQYVNAETTQNVPFNSTSENTLQNTKYKSTIPIGEGIHTAHAQTTRNSAFTVKAVLTYGAEDGGGPSGYKPIGNLTSSSFDTGTESGFNNISWEGSTPPGTTIKFQLASNNDNSTWNYLGPDGTGTTYYETPGELINIIHNNTQYIRYQATLETSDSAVTPRLDKVTINYSTE